MELCRLVLRKEKRNSLHLYAEIVSGRPVRSRE